MLRVKRTVEPAEVEESDLISLDEAARMSGRSISAIAAMMERGTLPWFQFLPPSDEGKRIQRFTSRQAVQQLKRLKPAPKR